ncbi:MAG: S1 RNA-binding domain-containing protein [Oscillospiraceae bacterium]|nr:S1 RNA-binding domain-containing protein [Oscillospiraceae bacterium]
MRNYYPEGEIFLTSDNQNSIKNIFSLQEAMLQEKILEARVSLCDNDHNLHIDLPCAKGIINREEGAIGISEGTTKDIALITKVNKPVCFVVKEIKKDEAGNYTAILSRRTVQERCINEFINTLSSGDVISAKVTHLEQFGAFVDIGCGIPSLIPIDAISISRISHPSDRFQPGQNIFVVVKDICGGRVWLSHKELLGTWEENASKFHYGETVSGIIRSVEDYGIFVELAPNLAGLAEPKEGVAVGQHASVYIKALIPEKMKVKLIIVDVFSGTHIHRAPEYFITEGHISHWRYSSDSSPKVIESRFGD